MGRRSTHREVVEAWVAYREARTGTSAHLEDLRAALEAAVADGCTQAELGRLLGIPRQHVQRYIAARR